MIMYYNHLASIWSCIPLVTFNDVKGLLFHIIFIPMWLTSAFLWTLYIPYWYLNSYSIFCIFLLTLSPFNPYLLLGISIHWLLTLMETAFEALGRIPILNILFLENSPSSSISYFKYSLSDALSPSKTLFSWTGALVAWSIIIPYEYYSTVIKYISKSHLYLLAQPSVSSHTFDIPDTNITELKNVLIDKTYERVNRIHIFHCYQLYMN